MHLAKLEQAGFLATGFRRAAGGGRPAKLYRLSDLVVTFGFPPRRYELLSRLALDALSAGGTRDDALRVCREAGAAEGRRALAGEARAAARPRRRRPRSSRRIAEEQGLLPEVAWQDGALSVVVNNCSFRELSGADPDLVCAMHRAFLEGVLQVVTAGLGRLRHRARATAASAAAASAASCSARSHRARSEQNRAAGIGYGRTRTARRTP